MMPWGVCDAQTKREIEWNVCPHTRQCCCPDVIPSVFSYHDTVYQSYLFVFIRIYFQDNFCTAISSAHWLSSSKIVWSCPAALNQIVCNVIISSMDRGSTKCNKKIRIARTYIVKHTKQKRGYCISNLLVSYKLTECLMIFEHIISPLAHFSVKSIRMHAATARVWVTVKPFYDVSPIYTNTFLAMNLNLKVWANSSAINAFIHLSERCIDIRNI